MARYKHKGVCDQGNMEFAIRDDIRLKVFKTAL